MILKIYIKVKFPISHRFRYANKKYLLYFQQNKRKNTIKSLTKIQNKYKVDRLQYKYNTKINIHRKYKDKVNKDTGKKLAQ